MIDQSEAIVLQETPNLTKLDSFSNVEEMMKFASVLISSKLVPSAFNTPEKVVAAVVAGKELGMGAMTSLMNLPVIAGRATLSVHAIGGLLRKGGIAVQTTQDFQPMKDKEGKNVDVVTTIAFFRMFNGREIEEKVSFKWSDATKMGLTTKDTWKSMPAIMLWNRCFAIGARRVAPDYLLGMYETAEWADVHNVPYQVNEEGSVTIIK